MKKLSMVMLLLTAVVFFSCENEQLIDEDLNIRQEQNLKTSSTSDDINAVSGEKGNGDITLNKGDLEIIGVELNSLDIAICPNTEIILYVDFSQVADYYSNQVNSPTPIGGGIPGLDPTLNNTSNNSSNGQSISGLMEDFISNYENKMSNFFTIYEIEESSICDYVYRWSINECEFYQHGPFGPPDDNDGEKIVNRVVDNDSDGDTEVNSGQYKDCF